MINTINLDFNNLPLWIPAYAGMTITYIWLLILYPRQSVASALIRVPFFIRVLRVIRGLKAF